MNALSHDSSSVELLKLAFRHKFKIVICPLLSILIGAAVFIYCPRTYRSEAMIFLRIGRETVGLDPTATTGHTMSIQPSDRKDEVKSALDVLGSREVATMTVDAVGPDVILGLTNSTATSPANSWIERVRVPIATISNAIKDLDPISTREEAIVTVEKKLDVHAERDSTVVNLRYEANSPQLAHDVCDAVVNAYLQEHLRIYRNAESRPFFAEQRDRLQAELDTASEVLRKEKDAMGIASVEGRRTMLEQQMAAVELERLTTQQQLATAKARSADLAAQLAKVPERLVASQRTVPNQGADMLRDQLYVLEMKAMDLKARYSDEHPLVQAVSGQLEEAERVVAAQRDERTESTDEVNPIHRELSLQFKQEQGTLAGLEARLVELTEQKATVSGGLKTVNENELKIDQLQRQADLARAKYIQYAQNFEEARMDKELAKDGISNLSVLQPATLEEKPVRPNKLLVILGTLGLAVGSTGSLIFMSESRDKQRRMAKRQARMRIAPNGKSPSDDFEFKRGVVIALDGSNGHGHSPPEKKSELVDRF